MHQELSEQDVSDINAQDSAITETVHESMQSDATMYYYTTLPAPKKKGISRQGESGGHHPTGLPHCIQEVACKTQISHTGPPTAQGKDKIR